MKKLLALSLLLISISTFAQKVKLALNLKTDSTYYLATNGKLTIVQDIPGHSQTVDMLIGARIAHKVVAIRDSVYDMQVMYASMSMHLSVGTMNIDMNSADKNTTNPLFKMLSVITNVPFSMTITKSGRVLTVTGMEKFYEKMAASFPQQVTEAQKAQFKNQIQQSFGEKTIRTNFQEAFNVFPKGSVGVNDTWTVASPLESSGINASITTSYVLKEISGDAYLVRGDAVVSPEANNGYRQTNGLEMRFTNIKGTVTTDLKLDKKTCWIIDAKETKNIAGTAEIKDSPKMPGGMSFPMTVLADLTVSGK